MKTIASVLLVAGTAAAAPVPFPPDANYVAFRCGNAPMTDGYRDEPTFVDDGDVVGTVTPTIDAPAALRASDATNLYLRIRLDGDPAPGGVLKAASWGVEFDLDNNHQDYELLVLVDGATTVSKLELFKNNNATSLNSPADPADTPPVGSYLLADNVRSVMAPSNDTGGNPDFFLDFAVPWADLRAAGLDHTTHTRVWVGSSSSGTDLNGDIACHDGASGAATLDGTVSDDGTADPAGGGSGSGSGTTGGTLELEGGGGCSAGGSPSLLVALGLLRACRRRRGSDPRRR